MEKFKVWWNDNIYLPYKYNYRYIFRDIINGISNLWKWFPIIWKDRDWDHFFIFEILKFKLQNQAKYIGDRNFHTRAKRDAELMILCTKLIDKLNSEFYGLEYQDYWDKEFSFGEPNEKGSRGMHFKTISKDLTPYFKKYPNSVRFLINTKNKFSGDIKLSFEDDERLALSLGNYNHQRAKKILFNILDRNIEGWWD